MNETEKPATESERIPDTSELLAWVRALRRAKFARLLVPRQTDQPLTGELIWAEGSAHRRTRVPLSIQKNTKGRADLVIAHWPQELRPMVAYRGYPNVCRIQELEERFRLHEVRLPRDGHTDAVDQPTPLHLAAADASSAGDQAGGEDEVDLADLGWEPEEGRGWIDLNPRTGLLEVHAELEDDSDPGMIMVELRWLDPEGEVACNSFKIELDTCDDEDRWSGRATIELPAETNDGTVLVLARTLSPEDLVDLSPDAIDGKPSEISQLIAKSSFQLHAITNKKEANAIAIEDIGDDAEGEYSVQAEVEAPGRDREDAAGERQIAPFERALRDFRDADSDARERLKELVWTEIANYFFTRFPTWSDEQVTDAIGELYAECILDKLPGRKPEENLTGWLRQTIFRTMCGDYRKALRNREFPSDCQEQEFLSPAAQHGTLDSDKVRPGRDFFQYLTQQEFHYWQLNRAEERSDEQIMQDLHVTREQVRTVKANVERKRFVFLGLDWIEEQSLANLNTIDFSDNERRLVELSELRRLPNKEVYRRAGLDRNCGPAALSRAVDKIHLAAAAWDLYLSDTDSRNICPWFSGASVAMHPVDSAAEYLGRRLHARILLFMETRRGPLHKRGRLFVGYRIIQRKPFDNSLALVREHNADGAKTDAQLQLLPEHVSTVWNATPSLVPESIRLITADWLRTH